MRAFSSLAFCPREHGSDHSVSTQQCVNAWPCAAPFTWWLDECSSAYSGIGGGWRKVAELFPRRHVYIAGYLVCLWSLVADGRCCRQR
eukprot:3558579-Prymnesium_polylepis.1